MVTRKKIRKSTQELAIEIKEREANEKIWNKYADDKRKLLEIKLRQFMEEEDKFKYEIIKEAGLFLEKLRFSENEISSKISRAFKGLITPQYIATICQKINADWVRPYKKNKFNISKHKKPKILKSELTQQEQEYLQAYEDEVKRNKQIAELIQTLTGLTIEQQSKIIVGTPRGQDFRKKLVEASKGYMLKIAKQMIRSDIRIMLGDLRTLNYLTDEFGDILYEEEETRKRREPLESA